VARTQPPSTMLQALAREGRMLAPQWCEAFGSAAKRIRRARPAVGGVRGYRPPDPPVHHDANDASKSSTSKSACCVLADVARSDTSATNTSSELVAVVSANTSQEVRERLLELADDLVFGAGSRPLSVRLR
jgi:hypothetical protein